MSCCTSAKRVQTWMPKSGGCSRRRAPSQHAGIRGEVETVARCEHRLDQGRFLGPFLHISLAVVPRLIA